MTTRRSRAYARTDEALQFLADEISVLAQINTWLLRELLALQLVAVTQYRPPGTGPRLVTEALRPTTFNAAASVIRGVVEQMKGHHPEAFVLDAMCAALRDSTVRFDPTHLRLVFSKATPEPEE